MRRKCLVNTPAIHDATHYAFLTLANGDSFEVALCDEHGDPSQAIGKSVEYGGRELAREYWPYAPVGVEMTPQERADYDDEERVIWQEEHEQAMAQIAERRRAIEAAEA